MVQSDILTFQGGAIHAPAESLMLQKFSEVHEKSHEPCVLSFHNLDLGSTLDIIFSVTMFVDVIIS